MKPEGNERRIGLYGATALVVANMVGTGVFTTSGLLIADLGSAWLVLLTWLLGGVMAALGALCYGALARHIPVSGGEYVLLSRTLHPALGYLAGWISLLVGFAVPLGALGYAFGQYLSALDAFAGISTRVSGTAIILIAAAVHAFSVGAGARAQAIAVAIELLVISLFAGFGLGQVVSNGTHNLGVPGHPLGLGVALIVVSYSYQGWNAAVYVAGEVREPQKNLPRALILGTGIVTLLYLGLNAVFVLGAPAQLIANKIDVGRIVALVLGGQSMAKLVSGMIAFALAVCMSSLVMSGPRVLARMAGDGFLPRILACRPGQPPRMALLCQVVLALIALWTATFSSLLTYVGFTLSRVTAACVVGLIWQRRKQGATLAVPGWPWVPLVFLLFVVSATAFTIAERPRESLMGLSTLLLGLLAYRLQRRRPRDT
jgi:APA family basic amino acid/polyamine antiporter